MNPIGCPAPRDANAMVLTRPAGKAAPRIPVPAGDKIAGAKPRSAMRIVNDKESLANDTASDRITNNAVPARKSVFRPNVSASPPASSKKVPFTKLRQRRLTSDGLSRLWFED